MPKIVILRGNSGSGKTTIAKELQKLLGYGTMLISKDVLWLEIMHVKGQPNNKVAELMEIMITFAFENCETVILEGILSSKVYEKLFDKIKYLYEDNTYAYYFDLTFEETLKRHAQRSTAHEFGETEMRTWWLEKDCLPNISEKQLNAKMSKADIVDLILKDLKPLQTMRGLVI